jgi:type II secretory pathway component PulF
MIGSGEETGSLDTVLDNMADYLEGQLELKRKVVSALLYPVLMLGFCVLVVIALLVFVVPNIVEIFEKEGTVLPLPTRILIGVSDFIANYWWLVGFLSLAFISALTTYYRSPGGRKKIDGLLLRLPVYGAIYTKVTTARVSRTLGTLLNGGVGLLAALEIVKNIVNNCLVSEALAEAKEGVREGRSLANELKKSGYFPLLLCQMVAVGEKSGHLEDMLTRAGKSYENEVNATLSGLTSLLTPVMTIFLGLIVLFIVVAALMPMMDMIELVQG